MLLIYWRRTYLAQRFLPKSVVIRHLSSTSDCQTCRFAQIGVAGILTFEKLLLCSNLITPMTESDQKTGLIEERRAAPRHKNEFKSSVQITAISNAAEVKEPLFVLQGQLLNVSLSGLAMTISLNNAGELKLLEEDLTLHLLLSLPVKAIELDATVVRYKPLVGSKTEQVLVGAHITNIKERDRRLFMEFINHFLKFHKTFNKV
jgi:hypothetical protein